MGLLPPLDLTILSTEQRNINPARDEKMALRRQTQWTTSGCPPSLRNWVSHVSIDDSTCPKADVVRASHGVTRWKGKGVGVPVAQSDYGSRWVTQRDRSRGLPLADEWRVGKHIGGSTDAKW